jgi:PAS domain S-box-containing protein
MIAPRNAFPSDHFAAFAFASADILIEVDEGGIIVFAEGAITGLLGCSSAYLTGQSFMDIVSPHHHKRVDNMFNSMKHLSRVDAVSLSLLNNLNESVPFKLSGIHIAHKGERFYLSLRLESEMQSLTDLDLRDPASGMLEKDTFAIRAGENIKKAAERGEALEITVFDFPGLKDMLDALSSQQSKQLMHAIGDYLKTKSVGGDTAGVIDRESYSIITPAKIDKEAMMAEIKEIARKEVSADFNLNIRTVTIATESDEYPLSAQDTANAVLYTMNQFAKQKGANFTIASLNDSYEEMLEETLSHISAFRRTLTGDEFTLAFQPIVNIRTGMVHHHECLVRLHHSTTFSNPFEFITFGEQSGIINEFDLVIAEKVLDIIRQEKKLARSVKLAINVSGKSLGSNLFVDTFLNLLRENKDIRSDLIVEITESYKIENMQMADDFVQTLRREGSQVCLDDFGSGDSSFDYLRHLLVDFIKIDGSYVRDAMKTERGRTLLKAMANLCRNLDMQTIGEMVETEKEAEFLWECGVQYGQGYLFGKPDTNRDVLLNHGKVLHSYSGIFHARRFRSDEDECDAMQA